MEKADEKKERNDVVALHEGKIVSPNEDEYVRAANNKIWLVGNTDKLSKTDRAMMDLIISGITGFNPEGCNTHMDTLVMFYDHLYPFIENMLKQYLFLHQEVEAQAKEVRDGISRNASHIHARKVAELFIKSIGKEAKYDDFRKKFQKEGENAAGPNR